MIVYGSLTDTSIGKLFIAGIMPGLLLTACFMLYIAGDALLHRHRDARGQGAAGRSACACCKDLVPPAVVFFIVMGSLYTGVATTTESAALGVVASLFFAWRSSRKLSWPLLQHCFVQTAKTSGMILLIITAAFILNLAISLTGVAEAMTQWVTSFGLSATQLLLVLMVFYFAAGHVHGRAVDDGGHDPDHLPDRHRAGRRPGLVRHLHRADVRAGHDHAAGGHEPVRGARHPARQGRHPRRHRRRLARTW